MIRFLMVKKERRSNNSETKRYYTIDDSVEELEKALTAGGHSESEFEVHELIGVEVK